MALTQLLGYEAERSAETQIWIPDRAFLSDVVPNPVVLAHNFVVEPEERRRDHRRKQPGLQQIQQPGFAVGCRKNPSRQSDEYEDEVRSGQKPGEHCESHRESEPRG